MLVTTSQVLWVRLRLLLNTRRGLVYLASLPRYIDTVCGLLNLIKLCNLEHLDHPERSVLRPCGSRDLPAPGGTVCLRTLDSWPLHIPSSTLLLGGACFLAPFPLDIDLSSIPRVGETAADSMCGIIPILTILSQIFCIWMCVMPVCDFPQHRRIENTVRRSNHNDTL